MKNTLFALLVIIPMLVFGQVQLEGKIVFVSTTNDGKSLIFLSNVNSSNERFLTEGDLSAISPDGKYIAYIQSFNPNKGGCLCVMNISTGVKKTIINKNACNPQWSTDSKHIVFEKWNGSHCEIQTIDIDGVKLKKIINCYQNPSLSPNGKEIAMVNNHQLYILNIAAKRTHKIADNFDAIERLPVWSPDGTKIAFHAETETSHSPMIYYIDRTTGKEHYITNYSSDRFCWASNTQIIYEVRKTSEKGNSQLAIINIDGTDNKILTNSNRDHSWPSFTKE